MCFFSVIIPVYKTENFIAICLESILKQTCNDYEIILIDDGSPDNSGTICEDYSKKNNNISVIHQQNHGASTARNIGLGIAKGKYIVFQDDDDYCRLNKIEKQVKFLEEQPHNIGMAYCITANHCKALQGNVDALPVLIPAGKENSYPGCDGFIYPKLLPKNFVACTAMNVLIQWGLLMKVFLRTKTGILLLE